MKSESIKCKRLAYKSKEQDNSPTIILGVVVSEDNDFLIFKTDKREYRISKSLILSIEDTNIDFRGGG